MRSLKFSLIAVAAFFAATSVNAQTAEEIVNKHLEALGGKDKIAQITSLQTESSFEIAGQQAPSVITILNGKGFKSEVDFGGQKIVKVINDKTGWDINPLAGQSAPVAMSEADYKSGRDQIFVGGALFNYAEKGNKIELVGRENVKGVNAFKLKVTSKTGEESFYSIDPSTYYVVKRAIMVNATDEQTLANTFYSNYKKTEFGFVVPYTMEIELPQFTIVSTVTKVQINKQIPEDFFKG